ncbi:hypothetical protein [Bartonella quintana]|nr:hypothetical protein [Bartonella quintana]
MPLRNRLNARAVGTIGGLLAKIMMVPNWLLPKRTNYDGNL